MQLTAPPLLSSQYYDRGAKPLGVSVQVDAALPDSRTNVLYTVPAGRRALVIGGEIAVRVQSSTSATGVQMKSRLMVKRSGEAAEAFTVLIIPEQVVVAAGSIYKTTVNAGLPLNAGDSIELHSNYDADSGDLHYTTALSIGEFNAV
jgi:hypothetical protein